MQALPPSMPLLAIGLNHKAAPVEVRERLAFGPERIPAALTNLTGGAAGIEEAVLLSTCNRTEIYLCARDPALAETRLFDFISGHAKLPLEQLRGMTYVLRGEAAAEHLMRVAAGLDSLVLGENEILGQVRAAAETAQAAGTTGPLLSALFRRAVQAGKRARAETEIGRGNVSVAGIVVEMAEQALGPINERTALLVGAGKISSITARALVRAGLRCILVANRTFEKAQKLAQSLNGTAVRFDALDEVLARADIVICSTGAPHLVLHADSVAKAQRTRGGRPLLVADLAVPRDADPQIAVIPGVRLANIDDLDTLVKTGHPLTASVCREVEAIVDQELDGFRRWYTARRCAPLIRALHERAEAIYQGEVEQTLRRLGPLTPRQQRLVQALGKAIAAKLLHEPTVRLREASPGEDLADTLALVQDLYGIR